MAVAVLIGLCFLAFAPVLRAYFVADDYVPMAYLWHGFHGGFGELVARLLLPWQDATVQLMYRPVCELTMILDYALFGPSAVGFHLSNLLWHVGATLGFYFVCREMVTRLGGEVPRGLPFAAAALFAVTPLHIETVAWMIGRVDSVCATFYFTALWCFLRGKRVLGLVAFVLALFSKEMAVTLPAVLVAWALVAERRRFVDALRDSAWYWALLAPYFAVRVAVLGTPTGGYIGSVGDMFWRMAQERFAYCRWEKVFYPYSDYALNEQHVLVRALRLVYAALAAVAVVRWRSDGWRAPAVRLAAFCAVWLAACVVPALSVWYLNGGLTGGRFLYLGSAPMVLFLSALVLGPTQRAGAWMIGVLCALFCCMSIANANVWVTTGERAQKLHAAVESELARVPGGKRIVLVNVPKQANDEKLFWTSEMLMAFFKQPFGEVDLSPRIACTQSNFYLTETPTNVARLRRMVDSGEYVFYAWDDATCTLSVVPPDVVRVTTENDGTVPVLRPVLEESNDSFLRGPLRFTYNVSMVPRATAAVIEISKPNCTFTHYTRNYRDTALSAGTAVTLRLDGLRGAFTVPDSALPLSAHYQVRVAPVDAFGEVVGTVSDPVSVDRTRMSH